jgi:hypothetical protein
MAFVRLEKHWNTECFGCSSSIVHRFLIASSTVMDANPFRVHDTFEGGPRMSIYDHLEFRHFKYIVAIAEAGTFHCRCGSYPSRTICIEPANF